jgi:hypothetical protein
MTTDEKHARIATALGDLWAADKTGVTTANLAAATGLSAAQLRSVTGWYRFNGRTVQAGPDVLRVTYNNGAWLLAPAEGWPAYWAKQPEAPF